MPDGITHNTQGYTIQGIPGGDNLMIFQVQEPSMSADFATAKYFGENGQPVPVVGGGQQTTYGPVSFSYFVPMDGDPLVAWFDKVKPLTGEALDAEKAAVTLTLSNGDQPVYMWQLEGALPTSVSGGSGNAQTAGRNEKTAELTFATATQEYA
jgi:hypothetical protein